MSFTPIDLPKDDVATKMKQRTLLQFRASGNFQAVLAAIASEVQTLLTAIHDVMEKRSPAQATGGNLDAIGRIVGQSRDLINFELLEWFTPDSPTSCPDSLIPVWVVRGRVASSASYTANDGEFRSLIEAKVARNHARYGSVAEVQDFIQKAYGINSSVITVAPMTVQIVVPDGTPENVMNFLRRSGDTPIAEKVHFLPIPAGVQISDVIHYRDL